MSQPINLTLDIPIHFAAACKTAGIDSQTALQQFIDQLSVYTHLTTSGGSHPASLASAVLNACLDDRDTVPPPISQEREVHIHYIQQVLQLARTRMPMRQKKKEYERLVDAWYLTLQQTSNENKNLPGRAQRMLYSLPALPAQPA